jgi:tRNA(His) 5'-end guanylyltransferase
MVRTIFYFFFWLELSFTYYFRMTNEIKFVILKWPIKILLIFSPSLFILQEVNWLQTDFVRKTYSQVSSMLTKHFTAFWMEHFPVVSSSVVFVCHPPLCNDHIRSLTSQMYWTDCIFHHTTLWTISSTAVGQPFTFESTHFRRFAADLNSKVVLANILLHN